MALVAAGGEVGGGGCIPWGRGCGKGREALQLGAAGGRSRTRDFVYPAISGRFTTDPTGSANVLMGLKIEVSRGKMV